jgi:endonuclease YncB( thermonuclease family)
MTNKISPKTLNKSQYSKLSSDIQTLITKGIETPNQETSSSTIQTYWQIGNRINQEYLSENSGYHNSILKDLSRDLTLERSTLSRCLQFFKAYKLAPKNTTLSWSHYRHLIAIKDKTLRNQLQTKAQLENWSKEQLLLAIKRANKPINPNQTNILTRPTAPTYLYKAQIIEVVDGDTIIVNIDLGFAIHKEQRIRFASLDTPEIKTQKGQESYQFLRDKLSQIEFIMIKTHKIDIYGRYLGHIFYDATNNLNNDEIFKSGIYLNEEILQKGFAELY